jgi:HrpA-like RNA helicase
VVVATNVAETSITLPDVTVVIDAGRVKENGA